MKKVVIAALLCAAAAPASADHIMLPGNYYETEAECEMEVNRYRAYIGRHNRELEPYCDGNDDIGWYLSWRTRDNGNPND